MNHKSNHSYTAISQAIHSCMPQKHMQNKLAVGVMALGLALSVVSPVNAATYTVTNTNSSGPGSLIEAIGQAETNPGKDTINLSSVSGEINLNNKISIGDAVDIVGPGKNQLALSFSSADTTGFEFSLPQNTPGVNSLRGLRLNKRVVHAGVSNNADSSVLNINDLSMRGLSTMMEGTTNVNSSEITGSAYAGVNVRAGDVNLFDVKISNNSGTAISQGYDRYYSSSIDCDQCLIEGNGSGIFDSGHRSIHINNSVIRNNRGGISSCNNFVIENSLITGNDGGINSESCDFYDQLYNPFVASLAIRNTVINANAAGIRQDGHLLLENVTLSNNAGIALRNIGTGSIINSTIVANAGGIDSSTSTYTFLYGGTLYDGRTSTPDLTVTNTIIAGNSAGGVLDVLGDTPIKVDHSLIQDLGSTVIEDVVPGSNLIGANPMLAALADNGGSTLTHALLAGSPAIDTGDATACAATDQRGVVRPQGAGCDMGAYEFEDIILPPTTICDVAPVPVGGNCADEVLVRSMADLDAYVASNFGKTLDTNNKPVYKNLRLLGDLGQTSLPFIATSPCAITLNANSSITGSDVTLHARQGLNVNWSADIDATGEACLIADKQHALLNGGNKVNANTLAIRGAKKAIVGFQANLNVNGSAELISTGSGGNSNAKIGNKTTVTAERFIMKADNIAELAFKANVSTTDTLSIASGSLATSETLLNNRSSVQAGADLSLNSDGKTSIGFHTTVSAGNNLGVNANTEVECSVASITSTTYSTKSGNCSSKLP